MGLKLLASFQIYFFPYCVRWQKMRITVIWNVNEESKNGRLQSTVDRQHCCFLSCGPGFDSQLSQICSKTFWYSWDCSKLGERTLQSLIVNQTLIVLLSGKLGLHRSKNRIPLVTKIPAKIDLPHPTKIGSLNLGSHEWNAVAKLI